MEDKTKYYIFDRKEIALVFAFIISIAITAFLIGVKVGNDYSYQMSNLTSAEQEKVELLSTEEEDVTQLVENNQNKIPVEANKNVNQEVVDAAYEKLKKEFEKLDEKSTPTAIKEPPVIKKEDDEQALEKIEKIEKINNVESVTKVPALETSQDEVSAIPPVDANKNSELSGKFTIQIGSHRSGQEAEKFAGGFRARGYQPFINEVELAGGTWYRVSLGVFNTIGEAKNYISKEQALFQGQDYIIYKFD